MRKAMRLYKNKSAPSDKVFVLVGIESRAHTMHYNPSKKRAYRRVLLLKNKAFFLLHKSPIVQASKFRVFWKLSDYQQLSDIFCYLHLIKQLKICPILLAVHLPVDTMAVSTKDPIDRVTVSKIETATNQGFKSFIIKFKWQARNYAPSLKKYIDIKISLC